MAGENSIFIWSRDHRTHHKFSETDADPHNAKVNLQIKTKIQIFDVPERILLLSHWLVVCEETSKGYISRQDHQHDRSGLGFSDHVSTQALHALLPLLCFHSSNSDSSLGLGRISGHCILHSWYDYNIFSSVFNVCLVLRYVSVLHFTWLVNSAAHM